MKKDIELEFRAMFPKKKYLELLKFLRREARDLGADDKRVWFFVLPDKFLKVTQNASKKSGKITLKLTRIGQGTHFKEIEFPILEESIPTAIKLFKALGYKYRVEPIILRHNFFLDGVEVALKHSKTWGYHLEMEVMIASLKEKEASVKKIFKLAKRLGVLLMSEDDLKKFTDNIHKKYRNPRLKSKLLR